ncbi:MAG: AAA family ATPase [Candidatus Woesearchaeota archaeon]
MGLFDDMLKSGESLIKNEIALDFEFIPKLLPYRESQQRYIAQCIKPLLLGHNGRNLFVFGTSGIGKTAAVKWVFRDLEDQTDEIMPLYVNCWQKNTTYKVALELCDLIGYRFTQNKKTDELFKIIKGIINKKSAVFCFDEADKLEDFDFLYTLLEDIYKRSIILVTNHKEWLSGMDQRIKSRLTPDTLEFAQYNLQETAGILKERMKYAFVDDIWSADAVELVVAKAFEKKDIRTGLYLMRQSAIFAEERSSKKIAVEDAKSALSKLTDFTIKKSSDLDEDTRLVLSIAKDHSGKRIGELYNVYKQKDGKNTYKTFQRKIDTLEKNKFISVKKISGGAEGSTTIVSYNKEKKLTDF